MKTPQTQWKIEKPTLTSRGKLEHLLELQRQLMDHVHMDATPVENFEDLRIVDSVAGMVIEASEALDPLRRDTRPWLEKLTSEEVLAEVREETIDVLFYLLETFILLGMDDTAIFQAYVEKYKRNMDR